MTRRHTNFRRAQWIPVFLATAVGLMLAVAHRTLGAADVADAQMGSTVVRGGVLGGLQGHAGVVVGFKEGTSEPEIIHHSGSGLSELAKDYDDFLRGHEYLGAFRVGDLQQTVFSESEYRANTRLCAQRAVGKHYTFLSLYRYVLYGVPLTPNLPVQLFGAMETPGYFRCDGLAEWVNECAASLTLGYDVSMSDGFSTQNNPVLDTPMSIVNRTGLPEVAPELQVRSVNVPSGPLEVAAQTSVNGNIRNYGDGPATYSLSCFASTDQEISDSDTLLRFKSMGIFEPSSLSQPFSINVSMPSEPATYYIGCTVTYETYGGHGIERSHTKFASSPVIVYSVHPDLAVLEPSVNWDALSAGQSFSFSAKVRNQGGGTAASSTLSFMRSFDSIITPNDAVLGTSVTRSLTPGSDAQMSKVLTAPGDPGIYYVGVCVASVIGEDQSTNNCSTGVRIRVGISGDVGSDLVLEEAPVALTRIVEPGERFAISVTAKNVGDHSAPVTRLRYLRSDYARITALDSEVASEELAPLASGEARVMAAAFAAPWVGGTYFYGGCIDAYSGEANTDNNCSPSIAIVVEGAGEGNVEDGPDLVVESPTSSRTTVTPGETFELSAFAKNQGGTTAPSVTLRYYISTDANISSYDMQLESDGVTSLDPGERDSESEAVIAPTSPGEYFVGACVDTFQGEANNLNNCSIGVPLQVLGLAGGSDLVVESPSTSRYWVEPGQSFSGGATVRNAGSQKSAATTLRFYRSTDPVITTGDRPDVNRFSVSSLEAGDEYRRTWIFKAPTEPGIHYFGACAEPVSNELIAANNCSAGVAYQVIGNGVPDLIVRGVSLSRAVARSGETVKLTGAVMNVGDDGLRRYGWVYQWSPDQPVLADDLSVGGETHFTGLGPGSEHLFETEIWAQSIPAKYFYRVCADGSDNEQAIGNNCSPWVVLTVLPSTQVLTVSKTGSGSVSASLPGIDCGTDCTEVYNAGAALTLVPVASTGFVFAGWTGDCSGTGGCTVTMDADRSVGASFDSDADSDGIPNFADLDDDGDGVPDVEDNCPLESNQDQMDTDKDGVGDVCAREADFCWSCLPSQGGWRAFFGER